MYFPPAPRPVPQHHLLLLSQQWPLRGLERWAEEGRSGGESEKREKGEHLVCRALISIALGEQALPTFPHTHTYAHIQSLTHSVMVGHAPTPPWGWKEGMCSADYSGSGCLREWHRVCATLCHCGTVHYPYPSVCISMVPARKKGAKASSNRQRLPLLRIICACTLTYRGWRDDSYSGWVRAEMLFLF